MGVEEGVEVRKKQASNKFFKSMLYKYNNIQTGHPPSLEVLQHMEFKG
jgi:hypothetical protein